MSRHHGVRAWAQLSRRRRKLAQAADEPCSVCGGAIDYELPANSRFGATTDHVDPLWAGGALLPALSELVVAHRSCNTRRSNVARAGIAPVPPVDAAGIPLGARQRRERGLEHFTDADLVELHG